MARPDRDDAHHPYAAEDLARCKDLGLSSRLIKPFSADGDVRCSPALSGQSVVGEELFEFDPGDADATEPWPGR